MEGGVSLTPDVVNTLLTVTGFLTLRVVGWLYMRTSAQVLRDREAARLEMVRCLPPGSRVVDRAGTSLLVEVGGEQYTSVVSGRSQDE